MALAAKTRGFLQICLRHRQHCPRCYSDFPKDQNSKFKYWEQDYSARTEKESDNKDPYHSMYEREAKKRALLSHVDSEGRAKMVDVSGKADSVRTAVARAR